MQWRCMSFKIFLITFILLHKDEVICSFIKEETYTCYKQKKNVIRTGCTSQAKYIFTKVDRDKFFLLIRIAIAIQNMLGLIT